MIGRLLCRIGLHRWTYGYDPGPERSCVVGICQRCRIAHQWWVGAHTD